MDPILLSFVTTAGTALSGVIIYLFKETLRLQKLLTGSEKKSSNMEAEIWALNTRIEQLSWMGDSDPIALIVADASTGLITEWSPGATMLLHFPARIMIGKPIIKIIPERFQAAHATAMDKLRAMGSTPRRGPFGFFAITQEGTEIPVEVSLSGWSRDSQHFVGAKIKPRIVEFTS